MPRIRSLWRAHAWWASSVAFGLLGAAAYVAAPAPFVQPAYATDKPNCYLDTECCGVTACGDICCDGNCSTPVIE